MKLQIDHRKISECPYSRKSDVFIMHDNHLINQLSDELLYGTPTCFLVSGYRGAGKTSVIKKVEELCSTSPKKHLFIYLNFTSYVENPIVLRRMIREIYLSFSETDTFKEAMKKKNPMVTSLELLYERTFNEVNISSKQSKTVTNILQAELNLKRIVPLLLFWTGTGVIQILTALPEIFKRYLFAVPIIWTLIEVFSFSTSLTNLSINEMERKSFYDDEIAETHLLNILKEINRTDIDLIFVIDELDKVDNEEEINKLICGLKPIMLSGLAKFILVSGQSLYYRYFDSQYYDDSIMSSLFSKHIHVPLLHPSKLRKIFDSMAVSSTSQLIPFIDSLILRSKRIPRLFINLIRQHLIWEENAAYIDIEDEKKKVYEIDAKLLRILNEIISSEISSKYDSAIEDFFIMQLHIWVNKIKLKKTIMFVIKDIYDAENDYNTYQYWHAAQLNIFCTILLEKLIKEHLLESIEEITNEETESYYKWIDTEWIEIESGDNNAHIKNMFIQDYIGFEQDIRNIYIEIVGKEEFKKNTLSLQKMLKALFRMEIISIDSHLFEVINLRNRVVHGEPLSEYELSYLEEYRFVLSKNKTRILEDCTYYMLSYYFTDYSYTLQRNSASDFIYDFIAKSNNSNRSDIIFELKTTPSMMSIRESINTLKKYNNIHGHYTYYVLLYFEKEKKGNFQKLLHYLNDALKEIDPLLHRYIKMCYCSDERSFFSGSRIKDCLNELSNEIRIQ